MKHVEIQGRDFSMDLGNGRRLSVDLLLRTWPPDQVGLRIINEDESVSDQTATFILQRRETRMMSCKGFLNPDKNRRPRMTAKHKAAIFKALSAARDHEVDAGTLNEVQRQGLIYAELFISSAIADYPTDRSCHTCDHFHGTTCKHYAQEVPDDAAEAGCDHHREHGTPF